MRVYRGEWYDAARGLQLVWRGNKADALRDTKAEAKNSGGDYSCVMAVDVPTDKAGLINWLNVYLNTDNG